MSNVNIHIQTCNESDEANPHVYENITDIELEVSDGDGYKSQDDDEYVIHDDITDDNKEIVHTTGADKRIKSIKYDHNNVYLQQIPRRNKCKVQIDEGYLYEDEKQQISENANQVFVTLAKRKSRGRFLSGFVPLIKSFSGWKCIWLTLGVCLIILISVSVLIGIYISAKKVPNGR